VSVSFEKNRNPTLFPNYYLVTEQIVLLGGALLKVNGPNVREGLVPYGLLKGESKLQIHVTGATYFNFYYMYSFEMDQESIFDVQSAEQLARIERVEPTPDRKFIDRDLDWWKSRDDDVALGQMFFSRSLSVAADNVFI